MTTGEQTPKYFGLNREGRACPFTPESPTLLHLDRRFGSGGPVRDQNNSIAMKPGDIFSTEGGCALKPESIGLTSQDVFRDLVQQPTVETPMSRLRNLGLLRKIGWV